VALVAAGSYILSAHAASAAGGAGFWFGDIGPTAYRLATPIPTTNLGDLNLIDADVGSVGLKGLVLAEDGRVFSSGQSTDVLGYTGAVGQFLMTPTPIDTTNLGSLTITQVTAGGASLLLAEDGSVFSFGRNGGGGTGQGTTAGTTPIATPIVSTNLGGRKITQLSARGLSLLLADDGSVYSMGDGTTIATPIDSINLGGRKITQVSSGWDHNLLLAEDGTVFSFGSNANGRTGLGTATGDTLVPTPIDTTNIGGLKITQVAAGNHHSLLLAEDGRVFSFGLNASGKTGLGTTVGDTLVATPIDMTNLGDLKVTQIAAGSYHSLVLAEDGRVFSFGAGGSGITGYGTNASSSVALPIDRTNLIGSLVTKITAGTYYSLIIAEPRLPGDYNDDGAVDAADYVLWRDTLEQVVPDGLGADGFANGEITILDYRYWRERFGNAAGAAAPGFTSSTNLAVPEPSASLLLLWTVAAFVAHRRRSR
jgi:alpha-tubulin suppressor-like RCC1 family protein